MGIGRLIGVLIGVEILSAIAETLVNGDSSDPQTDGGMAEVIRRGVIGAAIGSRGGLATAVFGAGVGMLTTVPENLQKKGYIDLIGREWAKIFHKGITDELGSAENKRVTQDTITGLFTPDLPATLDALNSPPIELATFGDVNSNSPIAKQGESTADTFVGGVTNTLLGNVNTDRVRDAISGSLIDGRRKSQEAAQGAGGDVATDVINGVLDVFISEPIVQKIGNALGRSLRAGREKGKANAELAGHDAAWDVANKAGQTFYDDSNMHDWFGKAIQYGLAIATVSLDLTAPGLNMAINLTKGFIEGLKNSEVVQSATSAVQNFFSGLPNLFRGRNGGGGGDGGRSPLSPPSASSYFPSRSTSGGWSSPLSGYTIVEGGHFGVPRDNALGYHPGIDLAVDAGTPVYSAHSGSISFAGWFDDRYGNLVRIFGDNGYETWYGHLQSVLVGAGQSINIGEPIGLVGSTGFSTGPHLHFEIRQNGEILDPNQFIPFAHGGIVTREVLGRIGEYGKKEAVIPLEDPQARRLLGGQGMPPIQVTIIANGADQQSLRRAGYEAGLGIVDAMRSRGVAG